MLSFFTVMLFTGFCVNIAFNHATNEQMAEILNALVENEGELPVQSEDDFNSRRSTLQEQYYYGMRYFTVIINSEKELEDSQVILTHVNYMDEETALEYAEKAIGGYSMFNYGSVNDYHYLVSERSDGSTIIAFVNSSIQSHIQDRVIRYTVLICAAGLFFTGIVVWLLSKRAIRSELESYRRQKEFITNASHELKTPLAVIRANTELLELTAGENEWTESTLRQVEHMNGLIQNLVMISRAVEKEKPAEDQELNCSEITRSVVEPYNALALKEKKELQLNIDEQVHMTGDESDLRQLVSLLTDNAMKYCDPEGKILVNLSALKKGKLVQLVITNSYEAGKDVDCSRFFDRFYREDTSHDNQQGYGIGLSMAESICKQYQGSIRAEWKEGMISFICVLRA